MKNFVTVTEHHGPISVVLPIEAPEVLAIGDQLEAMRADAYMNGYNWAALIGHYLTLHRPDLTEGLEEDPEGGTYVGYYEASPDNLRRAHQLAALLNELLNQPEQLYDFLRAEGDAVEWD